MRTVAGLRGCSRGRLLEVYRRWVGRMAVASTVGLAGFGCSVDDPGRDGAVVRDSAGVRIVENPSTTPDPLSWLAPGGPAIQIGRADGTGPDAFGSVRHAVRLASSAIAVADARAREIRVFDGEGRHLRTFGGDGEGPGEFANLWWIVPRPGDSVAALDNLGARISHFGPDGVLARSVVVPRVEEALAPNVVGVLGDGTWVFRALSAASRGAGPGDTGTVFVFGVGPGGEIVFRMGGFPDRTFGGNGLPLGFGSGAEIATGDSTVWVAHTGRFELHAYGGEGTLQRIIRLERSPTRVMEEEITSARAALEVDFARQGASGPAVDRILATEFAATHPVHGPIATDPLGVLWVARPALTGPGAPDPHERVEVWDVFAPDGRLLGEIETPEGFRATQMGSTFILGVHTDALGVERVRLYHLNRD